MSKKVKIIDGEDQSEDRSVVGIQSAAGSCKKIKEGSIAENNDKWFKHEKGSMTQNEGYKMDGLKMFSLGKM